MREKKKIKLKKFHFHPVTSFVILIFLTMLLSGIFSLLELQATYSKINPKTLQLENVLVTVENIFNYDGMKFLISNAAKNFISFTTLSTLLISLIGLSVAKSSGLIDVFIEKILNKLSNRTITFILIFLSTISSIINDVGYVILIPLAALIFISKKRNPLAGITAAFSGVAFGYGATIFVGSMEVNLNSITEHASKLIDSSFHVGLSSNLFILIFSSIVISIVGTFIIEKYVVPSFGKYKELKDDTNIDELKVVDLELEEQKRLEKDLLEKKGLKNAFIASIIILLLFIYMIVPNMPASGMLLDMNEKTYLNQLFGDNSYFQDGFTYMISLFFLITGIAYGIGSKTIKSDKDIIKNSNKYMMEVSHLITLIFIASQFIAVFKKTNLSTIITAWGANFINTLSFVGIPLIIVIVLVIGITNIFSTGQIAKWTILAPVVVPKMMQSNISPQFTQFIFRASDSITKGMTPLLAYFVIYIGYLNIYNPNKEKPISIMQSIKILIPYCLAITAVWLIIIILWYLVGLPIGKGIYPIL